MSRLVVSAMAGAVVLITLPTVAARADSTTVLSNLTAVHQIVPDTAEGYLFFSEGISSYQLLSNAVSGPVFVTTLSGAPVATIDQGDGVEGMALSPDGKTLYAALAGTGEVAAIDVTSIASAPTAPTQTLYPLTSGDVPCSLAVQSGKVWVSYNAGSTAGSAGIGDIDLSATDPSAAFAPATAGPATWFSAPDLAAAPDDSGTMVAAGQVVTRQTATFRTTTVPATALSTGTVGSASTANECGYSQEVAVEPGGTRFVAACSGHEAQAFSVTDVTTATATYAAPSGLRNVAAIAIAPDGTLALAGDGTTQVNTGGGTDEVVYVYSPGGKTAPRNIFHYIPGDGSSFVGGGLAWAADGTRLFAVTDTDGADSAHVSSWIDVLHSFRDPEITRATVALGGSSSAHIGKSVTITGSLRLGTGNPPSNTPITITRTRAGQTARHYTVTTGTKGVFSLTDKPPALGTYSYTARYAGNATTQAAARVRRVTITRIPVSLTLTTNRRNSAYRARVTVTAHLGTTYAGRRVKIYAQAFGSPGKVTIKSGLVNSRGYLTAYCNPVHSTTFGVYFGGDARYAPRTVTRKVYVRPAVSMSINGYYTSEHIGRTLYRVFHQTATLRAPVTVRPNKRGECVAMDVQQYANGKWYDNLTTGCGVLSSTSRVTWRFTLTGAAGAQFRIRADYTRRASDKTNLNAGSSWYYFVVVT